MSNPKVRAISRLFRAMRDGTDPDLDDFMFLLHDSSAREPFLALIVSDQDHATHKSPREILDAAVFGVTTHEHYFEPHPASHRYERTLTRWVEDTALSVTADLAAEGWAMVALLRYWLNYPAAREAALDEGGRRTDLGGDIERSVISKRVPVWARAGVLQ